MRNKILIIFFLLTLMSLSIVSATDFSIYDNTTVNSKILQEQNSYKNYEFKSFEQNNLSNNENLKFNNHSLKQSNNETNNVTVSNFQELSEKITYDAKNNEGTTYSISLNNGIYNINKTLLWGSSNHIKNLIIDGKGNTISGQNQYQFINLDTGHHLILKNLIIKNTVNSSTNSASVVVMIGNGTLTISNCTFLNNHGGQKGGVITNRGVTTITHSKFINNTVDMWGAIIWSTGQYGGNVKIVNNTFENNIANKLGNNDKTALIYTLAGGICNITNNTFKNNTGRCIHNFNKTHAYINFNKFISNNFTDNIIIRGGIIDNYEAPMDVINNNFNGTTNGELRGGIIYNEIGILKLNNNVFSNTHIAKGILNNQTSSKGGVIFNRNSTIEINNNKFNTHFIANFTRGGVIFNNMGKITIKNNLFNNTVNGNNTSGITIFNDVNGEIDVNNNIFNSKLSGTSYSNSSLEKFIYNSNVRNNEGNGTIGITNIIKSNPIITVNPCSGINGQNITLTANITTTWNGNINESYVIFKINGITLKYLNNSTIKVKVIDGKAILNYQIPENWHQSIYTIEAVYAGSTFFNGVRNTSYLT